MKSSGEYLKEIAELNNKIQTIGMTQKEKNKYFAKKIVGSSSDSLNYFKTMFGGNF